MAGPGSRNGDSLHRRSTSGFFGFFVTAGHDFLEGLSRTLGMDRSLLSLAALVIGLLLLVAVARVFFGGHSSAAWCSWLFLGLWLLSWLIRCDCEQFAKGSSMTASKEKLGICLRYQPISSNDLDCRVTAH
ncbi:hypothetical protein SSTU70S_03818 [Stutzerimonas stutzeri]